MISTNILNDLTIAKLNEMYYGSNSGNSADSGLANSVSQSALSQNELINADLHNIDQVSYDKDQAKFLFAGSDDGVSKFTNIANQFLNFGILVKARNILNNAVNSIKHKVPELTTTARQLVANPRVFKLISEYIAHKNDISLESINHELGVNQA